MSLKPSDSPVEHGFGLIITGGQRGGRRGEEKGDEKGAHERKIGDGENCLRAIVTFIMPGSIANQLNNELQEGLTVVAFMDISSKITFLISSASSYTSSFEALKAFLLSASA